MADPKRQSKPDDDPRTSGLMTALIVDDAQIPSLPSGPSFGTMQGLEGSPMSGKDGRVLGGKFRVIRELGAGGAGAVYEVLHEVTHHRRALKLMKLKDNEENVERIFREASAAGRIGNPHIMETLDAGRLETGEIYILMELLDGETLFRYIEKHRTLTLYGAVELICQAADGLHAAHEAGIVHRDVKPANIMVTQRDGKPFVKLLDFGISKFDPKMMDVAELTTDGAILGTPSYMAPEQLKSSTVVDRRADIFALGVTLYSACAGKRPFQGRTFAEIAMAVMTDDHVPLWDACPHLPPSFTQVVEMAMATRAEDRFATAAEFSDALRQELEGAFSAVHRPIVSDLPPPNPGEAPLPRMSPDAHDDGTSSKAVVHVELAAEPPPRRRAGAMAAGVVLAISCVMGAVAIGLSSQKHNAAAKPVLPPTEVAIAPQVQRVEAPPTAVPLPAAIPVAAAEPSASAAKAKTAIQTPGPTIAPAMPPKPGSPRTAPSLNRRNPYD